MFILFFSFKILKKLVKFNQIEYLENVNMYFLAKESDLIFQFAFTFELVVLLFELTSWYILELIELNSDLDTDFVA